MARPQRQATQMQRDLGAATAAQLIKADTRKIRPTRPKRPTGSATNPIQEGTRPFDAANTESVLQRLITGTPEPMKTEQIDSSSEKKRGRQMARESQAMYEAAMQTAGTNPNAADLLRSHAVQEAINETIRQTQGDARDENQETEPIRNTYVDGTIDEMDNAQFVRELTS